MPAVDPRTIRPEYVSDQLPPDPLPLAHRRIVRLVNKDTNHYLVHLPCAKSTLDAVVDGHATDTADAVDAADGGDAGDAGNASGATE